MKIICNCCKKQIKVENDIPREDYVDIEKKWGYFSRKDGLVERITVCEDCYEKWVSTFQLKPELRRRTELL